MNAVEIIMRRDGVLFDDAQKTVQDAIEAVAAKIAEDGATADGEEVWTRETGLEPDYLMAYMDAVYLAVGKYEKKKPETPEKPSCVVLPPVPGRAAYKDENGKFHKAKPPIPCRTYVNRTPTSAKGPPVPIFHKDFAKIRLTGFRSDERVVGWEIVASPWTIRGGDRWPSNKFEAIAVITQANKRLAPFVGKNTAFLNYLYPFLKEDVEEMEKRGLQMILSKMTEEERKLYLERHGKAQTAPAGQPEQQEMFK